MIVLKIFLIIYGIMTALTLSYSIYTTILDWRKKEKIRIWSTISVGLFIIPALLYLYISNYISDVWEAGGIRKYYKKKKEEEEQKILKKEEYDRITNAYKNGELSRDKLPRETNSDNVFEFNGDLAANEWKDLVYIENSYNNVLNDFFKRHKKINFKHNIRILYLPALVEELSDIEIFKYMIPFSDFENVETLNISSDFLLNDLSYPEDVKKIHHGVITFRGYGYNHGAEFLYGRYYHLEEGDDDSIMSQLDTIVREVYSNNTCALYYTGKKQETNEENYADDNFGKNIHDNSVAILIDEVRERIERLRQYGISESILMNMIQVKPKLSRLVITKDFKIFLPDYNNMEIKMEPLNKAVFLLFLRHQEGIIFKCMPDYKEELLQIYSKLKPNGLNDKTRKSIDDVCNPCLNSINEKCARIRGAFISQFNESLAKNYFIKGEWRLPKKIVLPRDLVIWEGKL